MSLLNFKKIKNLIVFLSIPFMFSACTGTTASSGNLQAVVNQHSEAIQQLQSQVSGVQPAQADNWSQVQSLRQEMATLKGDLDNLSNSTAHLGGVSQIGSIIARHDRALRLIESQLAMDLQLNDGNIGNYNVGAVTGGSSIAGAASTRPPSVSTSAQKPVQPTTSTGGDVTAQALYDSGINSFNNRNYANALNSFLDFTKVYSNHTLVSNAWFWQGESHYQMKNYAAAALAYEKVITGFPNSIKAPAAYLKQGMSFNLLNKKDAAKERLSYLVKTYPKAPEAKRAQQVLNTL